MDRCRNGWFAHLLIPMLGLLLAETAGEAAIQMGPLMVDIQVQGDLQDQAFAAAPAGYTWSTTGNVYNGWFTGDANYGAWTLNTLNVMADPDPVVSNVLAVTNNSLSTQTFTTTITLALSPGFNYTATLGSASGSVSHNQLSGSATVAPAADAIYTALINGATEATLITTATTTSGLSTATIGPDNFSTANSGLANSIGIQLEFSLTPGDSASFTSVFAVVPEPASMALVGGAVLGLVAIRRRA